MTNEELRALAMTARNVQTAFSAPYETQAEFIAAADEVAFAEVMLGKEAASILAVLDANAAMVAALRDLAAHAEDMEAQNADYHGPDGVVRSAPLNAAYATLALAENVP